MVRVVWWACSMCLLWGVEVLLALVEVMLCGGVSMHVGKWFVHLGRFTGASLIGHFVGHFLFCRFGVGRA